MDKAGRERDGLFHIHLSLLPDMCNSPDHVVHCHILSLKLGAL